MPLSKTEFDAILFERQSIAEDVAAILIKACGTPDAAEELLDHLIQEETTDDTFTWHNGGSTF